MHLNSGARDWLRWAVCLALIVLHWFVFVALTEAYITAYVTPRTGLYSSNPMSAWLALGPAISIVLTGGGLLVAPRRILWARMLLAVWLVTGAIVAVVSALCEIAAGREFLPDVVCIAWFFVFHALVIFAMMATRR